MYVCMYVHMYMYVCMYVCTRQCVLLVEGECLKEFGSIAVSVGFDGQLQCLLHRWIRFPGTLQLTFPWEPRVEADFDVWLALNHCSFGCFASILLRQGASRGLVAIPCTDFRPHELAQTQQATRASSACHHGFTLHP